ncbi:glyoxylate reductase/hydroxypyruvate reductase-like [Adelges cooleyi]|uniref:glyoxylate reductase/hydroxypyruvate reductase-like n=1 Tax=Adelges cooleyi TaxID=133065 RepID=UPI00217F6288|nr:glyoxylate reductase/hydroxypyruvate reductase-like [Adelges cooleyi]XP_050443257.1 glyoxylate reductase/hydroxypyruvate reductase-like [Adelges cooleyi]
MSKPKLLMLHDNFAKPAMDMLRNRFNIEICKTSYGKMPTTQDIIDCIPGSFGLFCSSVTVKISEDILKAAGPNFKVIGTMSVGYDHIDLSLIKKYGVRLGNTPGVLTEAVAELTIGLLIATTRRFQETNCELKTGGWKRWTPDWFLGSGLEKSTVGIIGYGNIGASVAEKLGCFKISELLYYSRSEKPAAKALGGKLVSVDELVKRSDYIIIAIALNKDTEFIMNRDRIFSMKPTAVLVNIGRGKLVDQDALTEALQQKRIRGAGLDVMTPEPLPLDDPLMKLDNCFLLPHIGSSTFETEASMAVLTAKNILAVLDNTRMPNEVKI